MLRLSGPAARCLGDEVPPVEVGELPRDLLAKAMRERRFKPRAARIDSTEVEADVRYRVKAVTLAPIGTPLLRPQSSRAVDGGAPYRSRRELAIRWPSLFGSARTSQGIDSAEIINAVHARRRR